jgi:hypothetical protein
VKGICTARSGAETLRARESTKTTELQHILQARDFLSFEAFTNVHASHGMANVSRAHMYQPMFDG